MPLGERGGWERTESRYCGVETDFSNDVTHLLNFNIFTGGFDYILAPLVCFFLPPESHVVVCYFCINSDLKVYFFKGVYFFLFLQVNPSYRPSLVEGNGVDTQVLPVSGSDLVLSPSQWSSHVVGMLRFASPPCAFVLLMNDGF